MLRLARTTKPLRVGRVEAVQPHPRPHTASTGAKDTKVHHHGRDDACARAEDDMVPNEEQEGSGASSTSTHDGPPGVDTTSDTRAPVATLQQGAASAHPLQTVKRTIQQAADVSESQTAEGRWCKLPRRQLDSHHHASADALSTADGLVDTDDDNAVALDAALLQTLHDVGDSCAQPCQGSAFQQQSSGKQRRSSRPTMARDADAGSSNSKDSEPQQHQLKVLPARPKALSPAVGSASTLPRGLQELAALGQQQVMSQPWAALSRQPSPAASSGLAPSASSAFTAVPRKHIRTLGAAMPMQQQPAFPPAGLVHILYTLPAPPLPFAIALPPPLHRIAGLVAPVGSRPPVPAAAAAVAAADQSGKVSARQAALTKYLLKRKNRNFTKKVLYESRKRLADARPRVRGQFVKAGEGPAAGDGTSANAKAGGAASRAAESACSMGRGA